MDAFQAGDSSMSNVGRGCRGVINEGSHASESVVDPGWRGVIEDDDEDAHGGGI